jgi:hypothetical protein
MVGHSFDSLAEQGRLQDFLIGAGRVEPGSLVSAAVRRGRDQAAIVGEERRALKADAARRQVAERAVIDVEELPRVWVRFGRDMAMT